MNKYTENSSKGFADLKYPKKIEIKKEMLPKNQLMIADLYNIPIGNGKKLVLNVIDKEDFVLFRRT